MPEPFHVRAVQPSDFTAWKSLWDGYHASYDREGDTALLAEVTPFTWARFLDPDEPVFALVAETEGQLLGLAHGVFHRSTTRIELTCYLQDLFTTTAHRGRGVGRALIAGVYGHARSAGVVRVYWHTHETNTAGRLLYDSLARDTGFILYAKDL